MTVVSLDRWLQDKAKIALDFAETHNLKLADAVDAVLKTSTIETKIRVIDACYDICFNK